MITGISTTNLQGMAGGKMFWSYFTWINEWVDVIYSVYGNVVFL